VFVPVEDSLATAPPGASNSPLGQLPIIPIMVAGIGAQFLGMARAALAVTIEILRGKVSVDPGASIRERPGVLADIATLSRGGHRHGEPSPCNHRRHVGQGQTSASDCRGSCCAVQCGSMPPGSGVRA